MGLPFGGMKMGRRYIAKPTKTAKKSKTNPLTTPNPCPSSKEACIDRESLADMLKEGLAKDYDGEGARPEW